MVFEGTAIAVSTWLCDCDLGAWQLVQFTMVAGSCCHGITICNFHSQHLTSKVSGKLAGSRKSQ